MKKLEMRKVSLAEVEKFYQVECRELQVEKGFIVENKMRGLNLVIPQELPVRGSELVDLTEPSFAERGEAYKTGINFGGRVGVLFGEFYKLKGAEDMKNYFRIMPKEEAPHMLVSVIHGERYFVPSDPKSAGVEGVILYYKQFVSGDGYGDDTWILPKDYRKSPIVNIVGGTMLKLIHG